MAYVNPQILIDQQQNQRNDQNYKAIGDSLITGIQTADTNRRRALDEKRAKDSISMDLAKNGANSAEIADYHATGNLNPILDRSSKIAEAARIRALDDHARGARKDESTIAYNNARAAKNLAPSGKMSDKEKIDYRINAQQGQQKEDELRKANIAGFDIADPGVLPSPKDAETVKKINGAHQAFEQTGKEIQDLLLTMKPMDYTGVTTKGKQLQQMISNAQIQQKTIKDLGVLNGPDLPLINKTLGDVGSMTTLATLGTKGAAERMGQAIEASRKNLHLEAGARGYKHKDAQEAKQTNQNLAPEDSAAIQWAQQNPNDPRASQILQLHGAK